jgi:hypothetical protein
VIFIPVTVLIPVIVPFKGESSTLDHIPNLFFKSDAHEQAGTQDNPVVPVPLPDIINLNPNASERLYLQSHHCGLKSEYSGEIFLDFEEFSILNGALTLGDLYDKVFRLVPKMSISKILLTIRGGAQLPYSSEAANKAGLVNGSTLICLASTFDSKAATICAWENMVTKAKELQSKGEKIGYRSVRRYWIPPLISRRQ